MATNSEPVRGNRRLFACAFALVACCFANPPALALEPLLLPIGAPQARNLPEHLSATQRVRVNHRALQSPVISIELMGETVVALRTHEQRQKGQSTWVGHIEGRPMDRVVVTAKGRAYSAMIQHGTQSFQLGLDSSGQNRLQRWSLDALPQDDAEAPPLADGNVLSDAGSTASAGATVEHDLLVVYTEAACRFLGSCGQLEADIVTAVADLNAAYEASGIIVRMNLVGTALTRYDGVQAGDALAHLAGQDDGWMDEVHALRDSLGADIVSLVYSGAGCGIGYINATADRAFNVTDVPCLLSNRTLAHEIAHNQGANHDRVTLGTPSVTTYNYGYRRCDDAEQADYAPAPHFRTIMSYSCGATPRRGIFSSPQQHFEGVAQGIDPDAAPALGTDNARRINERARTVADFRARVRSTPPAAPAALTAIASGPDTIRLKWSDRANDERSFTVQAMTGEGPWSTVASLPANTETWAHGGLQAGSTYRYRVFASNASGGSEFSDSASATTESLFDFIDDHPLDGRPVAGAASGTTASLDRADGNIFVLSETPAGRVKGRRTQAFGHVWVFDVSGGSGGVVAYVQAWVSGREGARFWYSDDDGHTRHPMVTVVSNASSSHAFVLPQETSGRLFIGVEDAEQAPGEAVDSVHVEQLTVRSWVGQARVPVAPEGLRAKVVADTSVALEFSDRSDLEFGFGVWRASGAAGDCRGAHLVASVAANDGRVTFTDDALAPETTYQYWVTAFNGAGDSACSDALVVRTSRQAALALLSARPYRVRGVQHVDLEWTASGPVDVYRDGFLLSEGRTGGTLTDLVGARGSGRYEYRVCASGTASCTAPFAAQF